MGDHVRFLPGIGVYQLAELGYFKVDVWTPERMFARPAEDVVKDLVDRELHFAAFAFQQNRQEATAQRLVTLLDEVIAEENRILASVLEYW